MNGLAAAVAVLTLLQTGTPVVRVNSPIQIVWDLSQQDQTDGQITRAEVSLDSAAYVTAPGAPAVGTGSNSYAFTVASTPGPHSFRVRWCNTLECGPHTELLYNVVGALKPPSGVKIAPKPIALTLPQAIELANSYSYVLRLHKLSDQELGYLASIYTGALEYEEALSFLDMQVGLLGR